MMESKPAGKPLMKLFADGVRLRMQAHVQPLAPDFVVMRDFLFRHEVEAAMVAHGPAEFVVQRD